MEIKNGMIKYHKYLLLQNLKGYFIKSIFSVVNLVSRQQKIYLVNLIQEMCKSTVHQEYQTNSVLQLWGGI